MKKSFFLALCLMASACLMATQTKVKASADLQAAINAASSGDTLLVQAGTYTGNFIMKEGVTLIGGWNALFNVQTEYGSILDANNSGRVLEQQSRFSTLTEWSGFTLQHGNAGDGAGALLREGGRLFKCKITENQGGDGGGICYDDGTAATVAVEECIVSYNKGRRGGGMWCKATVKNSIFEYNETTAGGAGVLLNPGRLIGCIVRFNKATEDFGGVRACSGTYPDHSQVINCLIYGNDGREVGGLSIDDNMGDVIGNTIVCNNHHHSNPESGVNINRNYSTNKECVFYNNVIWGNMKDGVVAEQQINDNVLCYENFANNAIATKVPDGITALILNADNAATDGPGFKDPTQNDFSLLKGSVLIDKGLTDKAGVSVDVAGKARVVGAAVDMGAYEFQSPMVKVGQDLQAIINATAAGETVYVQAGTFKGNFVMKDGVNVSGGWDETFSTQTQYGTILDGNANGRVVTQQADFTQLTVWDNLTIQNGKLMQNGKGAGVYLLWKSRLTNCLIQNNTFADNVTECEGGGLAQDKDDNAGDIVADNCVIRNNEATHGGGLYLRSTITNCVIENNKTLKKHPGGGAHLQWGRMYNCIIRGNHSSEDAGGVRAYGNCKLVNCLIADNTCDVKVAGIACERTLDEIINCTVVNNNQALSTTDQEYCGIRFDSDNADGNKFVNNIVWGNKAGGVVQSQQVSYSICKYGTATNNAIEGNVPGAFTTPYIKLSSDNAAADGPKFVDPANGNYALLAGSVLIDKGLTSAASVMATDVAGMPRIYGAAVDLGAYENQTITVKVGGDLQAAVNAAEAGDVVYVQAGTFKGNFTMKEGVQVSGGWNETFTEQTDYATVLDGNANGRVLNQPADFTTLTIWENLTIQNGSLAAALSDNGGSGVALMAYGQVKHCLIQNNTFTYTSGNCIGGGVFNNAVGSCTEPLVVDCWIKGNTATHGGGARVAGIIMNSIIENNSTTNNAAGGVQLHYGAGLYNSIVRNNVSGGDMGGVRMTGTKPSTMANCLVYGNEAAKTIGGVSVENGVHYLYNNTIVGNNQKATNNPNRAGIRVNVNSDAIIANNIIWGNMANSVVQASQVEFHASYESDRAAKCFLNNAFVYSKEVGTNSIMLTDADPGFKDAANADFSLTYSSILLDKGDDAKAVGETDILGKARIAGTKVDLGAYELPWYKMTVTLGEATITVLGQNVPAGEMSVPEGFTCEATIAANEGYEIVSVKVNGVEVTGTEGVYTLPAVTEDVVLVVETKQGTGTGIDELKSGSEVQKVLIDGKIMIRRDGKTYNVLGAEVR